MKKYHASLIALATLSVIMFSSNLSVAPNITYISSTEFDLLNTNYISDIPPLLTWTSRTQTEPLPINNGNSLIGDHVVVNATFPEELNITRSELKISNGFIYSTTRSLVIPTNPGGVFEGIIDPSEFDWITILGIEAGFSVNITCNFTNTDSDFMAWPDSINPSERAYANNLVDMASGDKPEHDSIIWPETGSMHLACLNYDGQVGNWTLYLEVGARRTGYANGSSITLDTYYMDRRNATYDILATGYSSSNDTYQIMKEDVSLCNFFSPHVSVYVPEPLPIDEKTFNVTWSSFDDNQDDMNLYSVWISNNDGRSFILAAQNLTRIWWTWNSSGWLDDSYIFRIRAYSIDLTSLVNDLSHPPYGYWPGDYNDGFSTPIAINWYNWSPPPRRDILVRSVPDISIREGMSGYSIDWVLFYEPRSCSWTPVLDIVSCEVFKNGTLFGEHLLIFYHDSETLSISLDNLTIGTYNFTLYYKNPGASGGIVRDVVLVVVMPAQYSNEALPFSIGFVFVIISLPCIALIVMFRITGEGFDRDVIRRLYSRSNIRLKLKLCTSNVRGQWRVN